MNECYQKGKIYKITCATTGLCYVGSTTKLLKERLRGHEMSYKHYLSFPNSGFVTSFDVLENQDYSIELIESVRYRSKEELYARERWWIEHTICVNKNIAGRSQATKARERREAVRKRIADIRSCECE
jgi:hypothetical protein